MNIGIGVGGQEGLTPDEIQKNQDKKNADKSNAIGQAAANNTTINALGKIQSHLKAKIAEQTQGVSSGQAADLVSKSGATPAANVFGVAAPQAVGVSAGVAATNAALAGADSALAITNSYTDLKTLISNYNAIQTMINDGLDLTSSSSQTTLRAIYADIMNAKSDLTEQSNNIDSLMSQTTNPAALKQLMAVKNAINVLLASIPDPVPPLTATSTPMDVMKTLLDMNAQYQIAGTQGGTGGPVAGLQQAIAGASTVAAGIAKVAAVAVYNSIIDLQNEAQQLQNYINNSADLSSPANQYSLQLIQQDITNTRAQLTQEETELQNLQQILKGPAATQIGNIATDIGQVLSTIPALNLNFTAPTPPVTLNDQLQGDVNNWLSSYNSAVPQGQPLAQVASDLSIFANAQGFSYGDFLWGSIEKWVFGQLMSHLTAQVSKYQALVNKEMSFLNVLGPMAKELTAWSVAMHLDLPATPASKHTKDWVSFSRQLSGLRNWVNNGHLKAFYSFEKARIESLRKIATRSIKGMNNAEFTGMCNSLSSKLKKMYSDVKKVAAEPLAYFKDHPSKGKIMLTDFNAFIHSFFTAVKGDGSSIQNLSNESQSTLRLQLMYYQEFMQCGPQLIQTLDELVKAVAQNLKGQ